MEESDLMCATINILFLRRDVVCCLNFRGTRWKSRLIMSVYLTASPARGRAAGSCVRQTSGCAKRAVSLVSFYLIFSLIQKRNLRLKTYEEIACVR